MTRSPLVRGSATPEHRDASEVAMSPGHVDHLIWKAEQMRATEKALG
jgi:hypothetical protein